MYASLDSETVDETAHDLRIDSDVTEVIRIYCGVGDDGEIEETTQVLEIEFDPDATQEN